MQLALKIVTQALYNSSSPVLGRWTPNEPLHLG